MRNLAEEVVVLVHHARTLDFDIDDVVRRMGKRDHHIAASNHKRDAHHKRHRHAHQQRVPIAIFLVRIHENGGGDNDCGNYGDFGGNEQAKKHGHAAHQHKAEQKLLGKARRGHAREHGIRVDTRNFAIETTAIRNNAQPARRRARRDEFDGMGNGERNYGHDNGRHDGVNGGELHARQRNFVRPAKPNNRTEPIARNNSACDHGANNADKQQQAFRRKHVRN